MKVIHYEKIEATPVRMEGARGCQIRNLVNEADGAPTFAMRQFEIAPGGHTPRHAHPHEHEVFVLEGNGIVMEGDAEHKLTPGVTIFIPGGTEHQFRNQTGTPLKFLCLIPNLSGEGSSAASCGCQ